MSGYQWDRIDWRRLLGWVPQQGSNLACWAHTQRLSLGCRAMASQEWCAVDECRLRDRVLGFFQIGWLQDTACTTGIAGSCDLRHNLQVMVQEALN